MWRRAEVGAGSTVERGEHGSSSGSLRVHWASGRVDVPAQDDTRAESRRQWKLDRRRSRKWEPTRSTRCDRLCPLLRSRWRCRGRAVSLGAGVGLRFRRGDQGTIDDLQGPHCVGYQAHAAPAGFGAHDAQHGREWPIGGVLGRRGHAGPAFRVCGYSATALSGAAASAVEIAHAGHCFSRRVSRRLAALSRRAPASSL
jgi:hypothetical protein